MTLPNARIFYAKYAMVSKRNLPSNVIIARTYVRNIGPRRQKKRRVQRGRGLPISLQAARSTAFNMEKKAVNTKL